MTEIPSSVLVVDDEVQIRRFLRTGFELDGFTVQEAETGAEALRSATLKPSDLVILDLGLPDMDGADVLERLRAWSTVPLIVLSVRANEAEKVRLLELGADDYVVKPFGMAELLARAHSAMRRQLRASRGEPVVKFGPLSIDFAARAVFINDQRVTLTPKEYRLLQILAQHSGNVVTHQFLLREVWGNEHIDDTHYLRIFVRKLRRKIEADPTQPAILLTELGVGYRLVMSDPPAAAAPGGVPVGSGAQEGAQASQPGSQPGSQAAATDPRRTVRIFGCLTHQSARADRRRGPPGSGKSGTGGERPKSLPLLMKFPRPDREVVVLRQIGGKYQLDLNL